MTKREFLKLLRKTPRRWSVDNEEQLRCAKGDCPITAVFRLKSRGHRLSPREWENTLPKLGLNHDTAVSIVDAADTDYSSGYGSYYELRRSLLRACGLSK